VIFAVVCALAATAPAAEKDAVNLEAPALVPDAETVERITAAFTDQLTRQIEQAQFTPEQSLLYQQLMARNRELLQRRRQLEYEDPIASGLKKKLVAAEKDVLALRRSLQARLDAIEEIQEVEAERRKLMSQLQELKRTVQETEGKGDNP
jgi:hypothetical protein